MTRREETVWTLCSCGIGLVVVAFLADEGNALAVFAVLGVPLAVFLGVAYLAGKQLHAGWISGTTGAFIAVALLEGLWETHLHQGPNSMPGFVLVFMSYPLSFLALIPARGVAQRLPHPNFMSLAALAFLLVLAVGSTPVILSLVTQSKIN